MLHAGCVETGAMSRQQPSARCVRSSTSSVPRRTSDSASATAYGLRPRLEPLNQFIVCGLCDGYLVDATTVAHCLHSCEFYKYQPSLLHCALAAAQCIVIGPVCLWVCGCVCGSVTTITRNCVHRSSPNWVCIGKGSDHLQSLAVPRPREGGLRRGENFCLRLTTASAQCLRLL